MSANALQEWFAFGVFASWTSALLVTQLIRPSTGLWGGEDAVRLAPFIGLLVVAAAPLYLRTRSARHHQYRDRFQLPLALGILHAPLIGGTMWLAEATCPASVLGALLLTAMLGWPILLGELAYRACRLASS